MSKFFIQLLISTMLGVGAALGFNPEFRSELKETLQGEKNSVRERATELAIAFDAAVSANAQESTGKTEKTAELKMNNNLTAEVQTDNRGSFLSDWFVDLSTNSSLEQETEANSQADAPGLDTSLDSESATNIELNLQLGK